MVNVTKGMYKGQRGVVKDVNRYDIDPLKADTKSGLMLTIEHYVFSNNTSNQLVKVDYDAVRYHGCVFFCLSNRIIN